MNQWHKCDVSEVALEFGADIKNGRSNVKPDRKRRSDNNIFLLPAVDSKSMVKKLMSDASVALLAIVYVLTSFLGYLTESFSAKYGARNMRRYIQRNVEDPIAEAIVSDITGKIARVDVSVKDNRLHVTVK